MKQFGKYSRICWSSGNGWNNPDEATSEQLIFWKRTFVKVAADKICHNFRNGRSEGIVRKISNSSVEISYSIDLNLRNSPEYSRRSEHVHVLIHEMSGRLTRGLLGFDSPVSCMHAHALLGNISKRLFICHFINSNECILGLDMMNNNLYRSFVVDRTKCHSIYQAK